MNIIVKEQPEQTHESEEMSSRKGKHIINVAREKLRNSIGETGPQEALKVRLRGLTCVLDSPH